MTRVTRCCLRWKQRGRLCNVRKQSVGSLRRRYPVNLNKQSLRVKTRDLNQGYRWSDGRAHRVEEAIAHASVVCQFVHVAHEDGKLRQICGSASDALKSRRQVAEC